MKQMVYCLLAEKNEVTESIWKEVKGICEYASDAAVEQNPARLRSEVWVSTFNEDGVALLSSQLKKWYPDLVKYLYLNQFEYKKGA